jgi:hypothetical protein
VLDPSLERIGHGQRYCRYSMHDATQRVAPGTKSTKGLTFQGLSRWWETCGSIDGQMFQGQAHWYCTHCWCAATPWSMGCWGDYRSFLSEWNLTFISSPMFPI